MTPISAIIITLNEEDRIAETVRSLNFCDEVLVVDAGSSDQTQKTARRAGARVLERTWTGYSDQKNYAAEHAAHDWVFSVDADERPSPTLAAEIEGWKQGVPDPNVVACSMPRLAHFMGRWIRHSGWYPDRKVRLYDRRQARWVGEYVHEGLEFNGLVTPFGGDLLHFPYRSLDEHRSTMERYTSLAAAELKSRGYRFNPMRLLLYPPAHFIKSFVLRSGFLDGIPGLRIACMAARYVFLREFRILR